MPAMPATYPVQHHRGIRLPALDLWLDPRDPKAAAVVSHAHSDHVARHAEVLCSAATARILDHRFGGAPRRGAAPVLRALGWGEQVAWRDALISLHPAGHVLGSAQVLVRHRGIRVLFSGDVKLRPGRSCEPVEHVEADLLIVESTFGSPGYRFPPGERVVAEICDFCAAAVRGGVSAVLLGYSLGKGQELLACLRDAGLPVALHPALHAHTEIYRALGVELPPAVLLDGAAARPCVAIVPPQARRSPLLASLGPCRTAYVSGWAVHPGAAWRMEVDAGFPLSDHADFGDLVTYVERTRARRVYTVMGFVDELAAALRRRGIDARPLAAPEQLAFELGVA